MSHLKNQKGFALVLILSLLPIIIGLALAAMFSMNFMRMNAHHLYICRTESIQVQNKVGQLLEKLLALNKTAERLRIEKEMADEAYALALTNMGAGLAVAEAMQLAVRIKRVALDLEQKSLIARSNMHLVQVHTRTARDLKKNIRHDLSLLKPFIISEDSYGWNTPPLLAVRPDITDIAPVYNPVPQFENRMKLVHRWQYKLKVASYLGSFLKGEQKFDRECAVTLVSRGSKWEAEIREDKSLLRSVF